MTKVIRNKTLWEQLIAYFPLIRHGPPRKERLHQVFVAAGTSLSSCHLATIEGYKGRLTDKRIQQLFYCCMHSFP
jgi:hypothetical protein